MPRTRCHRTRNGARLAGSIGCGSSRSRTSDPAAAGPSRIAPRGSCSRQDPTWAPKPSCVRGWGSRSLSLRCPTRPPAHRASGCSTRCRSVSPVQPSGSASPVQPSRAVALCGRRVHSFVQPSGSARPVQPSRAVALCSGWMLRQVATPP
eukprot:6787694-Prymnesium_polylepis.1